MKSHVLDIAKQMDAIQAVADRVRAATPIDLSAVCGPGGPINLRALVPLALTLSAQTEALGPHLVGPQKLRVVQTVLVQAIEACVNDPSAQKELKSFIHDQLPWVLEGAIKAFKQKDIFAQLSGKLVKSCC